MKKKLLTIALFTAIVAQLSAATVYVGRLGFDADRITNETNYNDSFADYMINNVSEIITVDISELIANTIYEADKYSNAPEGEDAYVYAATSLPANPVIWDGTGNPADALGITGGVNAISNASGTVMTGLPLAKAQFDITLLADNVAEIAEIVVYKGTTEAFTVAGPFTTTGTTLGDTENEVMTISTTTGVETEFTIKCYTAADVMVGVAKTVGLSWDNGNVIVDVK